MDGSFVEAFRGSRDRGTWYWWLVVVDDDEHTAKKRNSRTTRKTDRNGEDEKSKIEMRLTLSLGEWQNGGNDDYDDHGRSYESLARRLQ